MEQQTISPPEVQQLKGIALHEALRDLVKDVSNFLKNGGTIKELEEKGFKFGKVNLQDKANQRA